MNMATENVEKFLEMGAMRYLAEGFDTPTMDAFIDQLFGLARDLGHVSFSMTGNRALAFCSTNLLLALLEVPRPNTKIRMLCARLAVRYGEVSGKELFPYGDTFECEHPGMKQRFHVRFENTPGVQEIAIEVQASNGAPKMA